MLLIGAGVVCNCAYRLPKETPSCRRCAGGAETSESAGRCRGCPEGRARGLGAEQPAAAGSRRRRGAEGARGLPERRAGYRRGAECAATSAKEGLVLQRIRGQCLEKDLCKTGLSIHSLLQFSLRGYKRKQTGFEPKSHRKKRNFQTINRLQTYLRFLFLKKTEGLIGLGDSSQVKIKALLA